MFGKKKIVVEAYRGRQAVARKLYVKDVQRKLKKDYHPVSENWQEGAYGAGAFIFALLLCFILIGFIVFIYMMIVKPPGTLTVTYEYRKPEEAHANEAEKICPECAEKVKAAAVICRFCSYKFEER